MDSPSATPRRVRTPSWLDLRLALGVGLVLAAVLAGALVVAHARRTTPLVAVTRDLAAGTVIRAGDLRVVSAQLPADGRAAYLPRPGAAIGKVLVWPVQAGELLPAAALHIRTPTTTLSVSFPDGAAPQLATGQRIEVWLTTAACPSVVLLPGTTVQQVSAASAGAFAGGGGQQVVVNLDPALAQRVVTALAVPGATIRAGVLDGPGNPSSAPPDLPDLTGCAGPSGAPSR